MSEIPAQVAVWRQRLLPSLIRHVVPAVVGWLLSVVLIAQVGAKLGITQAMWEQAATAVVTALWYGLWRVVELYWPRVGAVVLGLGVSGPTYVPRHRANVAEILGRALPSNEGDRGDSGTAKTWLIAGWMTLIILGSLAIVAVQVASAPAADAHTRPVEHVSVNRVTNCMGVLSVAFSLEVLRGRQWTFRQDDGGAVVEVHHLGSGAGPGGHWEAYRTTSGGEGHLRVDTSAGIPYWDSVRVRHAGWTSSPALPQACQP